MRIAVVASHYPPNFTSGGTLIPQRIAAELAARGDEVFVFAGALDADRPDLTQWVDAAADNDGVEVTWTVINSMIDWDSEDNYRNPRVDAAFADFLARVHPDVVHLHGLQGFGAGPVSLAKAAGAAVVVTMHDMWWFCARQFLVQKDMKPCCPVVNCGVCPCERDNQWLNHRNRRLAAQLGNADLVLAPSSTMLELLRANGVDDRVLKLDENAANPADTANAANAAGPATGAHQVHPALPSAPIGVEPGAVTSGDPAALVAPTLAARSGDPERRRVRFVYAGGWHPLKGSAVTLAAARLLAGVPGWELDLYGWQPTPDDGPLPSQVQSKPAYPAGQVRQVLSQYDVLLMPSVATESYSLITREALDAGIPVISGDNPGPTEVVHDGSNGLVVPRGDAAALAAAMRTLISDRELLTRLTPAPGQVELRSLTEQVDELQRQYRRLTARPDDQTAETNTENTAGGPENPAAATVSPATGLPSAGDPIDLTLAGPSTVGEVLLVTGIDRAPLRYRGRLPQEALADLGVRMHVRHYRDASVPELARRVDAVVLYRVPATDQLLDVVSAVRARPEPVPVLFDVDDLVFDPSEAVRAELADRLAHLPQADRDLYWRGVQRYRTTLELADGYIGSTPTLCRAVDELTGMPSYLFPNGVGKQLARASDRALRAGRVDGPPTIGYLSGTSTHNEDWAFIEPAVLAVLRRNPKARLVIGGLLEPSPALAEVADRIVRLPLLDWRALPAVLRDLTVNLAPLAPADTAGSDRFNQAKSAIKYLEAALVQTPTVASPTEPFRADIDSGRNGLLAQSPAEWEAAIEQLVADPAAALRMGVAAQHQVLLTYPPAVQGRRYLQILQQARKTVALHGHRQILTDWQPVTDSEVYAAVAAEPYDDDPEPVGGVALGRRLRDYRVNAVSHLRSEGLGPTLKKTASVGRRITVNTARRAPDAVLRRVRRGNGG